MKAITHFFLVCFFLCASLYSWGQNKQKIDSLIQLIPKQKDYALLSTYKSLFKEFIEIEPNRAKIYLDAAKPIAERLNNELWKANGIFNEGWYYHNISDFAKSADCYKRAIKIYTENGYQQELAGAYNHLGVAQKNLGQTAAALGSYLSSIKIRKKLDEPEKKLMVPYLNIGVLYAKLGNIEMSNEYYAKTEALCIKYDVPYGIAIARSNRATNLVENKRYKDALDLYYGAVPYFEENDLKLSLAEQYNLIGATYVKMDSLSMAKIFLNKSIELSKTNGEISMVGLATRNLGDVFYKEKKYASALSQFQNSLEISRQTANNIEISEDYLKISQTYEKLGNLSKAIEYRKLYSTVHDSVFNQENKDKFRALELNYETEKSEQEIALQKKEIALLEEKEKLTDLQRLGLLASLIITVLLFGITYYGIRQKMKRNKLERERVDAELAFKRKELTTHALNLARKNETLESLKSKAQEFKKKGNMGTGYNQLIRSINFNLQDDNNWENFSRYFEEVHKDFNRNVKTKYPEVSSNELRLLALLKMNLSSKEIANILNISAEGIKKARYRLRKKLDLTTEESLQELVLRL
jgi:tetratricopeptide (TPR) repeat protein